METSLVWCRYALSVIGLFLLALLQEFLSSYRADLGLKAAKTPQGSSSDININLTGGRCESMVLLLSQRGQELLRD